jgi:hypothetical protein
MAARRPALIRLVVSGVHLATDAAGADDAQGLALQQQRPIGAVVECAGRAVIQRAVQFLGEMQDTGDGIFRHRKNAAHAARCRHRDVAAPQIADAQVAGPCRTLMEPRQPRRPRAQIERKRKAADDHFGFAEQPVALGARANAGGPAGEIARAGIGRPGLADLAVEPAAGVGETDSRIDRLDLGAVGRAEAMDGDDVDGAHGGSRAMNGAYHPT